MAAIEIIDVDALPEMRSGGHAITRVVPAERLSGRAAIHRVRLGPEPWRPATDTSCDLTVYVLSGAARFLNAQASVHAAGDVAQREGDLLRAGDLAFVGGGRRVAIASESEGAELLVVISGPAAPTVSLLDDDGPARAQTGAGVCAIVGAEDGEATVLAGDLYRIKLRAALSGGDLGVLHFHIPPGGGPVPHIHHGEEEVFVVLQGELALYADGARATARPGHVVYLPRDVPHGFHNRGEEDAAMLCLLVPGGGEQFFVEAGRPPAAGEERRPGPPDAAERRRILAAAERWRVEMLPHVENPYGA